MARRIVEHVGFTADDEPADVVDLGGRRSRPQSTDATADDGGPKRRWPLAAVAVVLAFVASVVIFDSPEDRRQEREAASGEQVDDVTVLEPGRVVVPAGPTWIDPHDVFSGRLRGTVERYWPTAGDLAVDRVHVVDLTRDDPPAVALLVADATRRAQVRGSGDREVVANRALPAPTRVLPPLEPGAPTVWEWDVEGFGFSLFSSGLDDAERAAIARAVVVPRGRSLVDGVVPFVDLRLLPPMGLSVHRRPSAPATTVGGPLIGQGGVEGIEAYAYRASGPDAGSYLVTATRGRAFGAATLAELFGDAVTIAPPGPGFVSAVELASGAGQLVGFRVTGRARVLLDHESGVVFELASDVLDADQLVAQLPALDLERMANSLPGPA